MFKLVDGDLELLMHQFDYPYQDTVKPHLYQPHLYQLCSPLYGRSHRYITQLLSLVSTYVEIHALSLDEIFH